MKIHVSHILVKYQYEAEDLLRSLDGGKKFEDLARQFSQCSSAQNGGDLGLVAVDRFDDDFADAALALKVGQISAKPVRSKFGFHLIKRLK